MSSTAMPVVVERPDDPGRQSGAGAHRRPQAQAAGVDRDLAIDQRRQRLARLHVRRRQPELHLRAAGLALEFGGRTVRDRASVVDDHDPIGERVSLLEVLGGQQQRDAVGDQPSDHVPHPNSTGRVQAGRRLVEKQNRRTDHQTGGQVKPSPHAAAVGLRHPVGGVAEVEAIQQLGGARPRLATGQAAEATDHHQVLPSRERLIDRGVLRGDADLALDLGRVGDDVDPGHPGDAVVGDGKRRQDPDGGRLARAVGPQHSEHRARLRLKVQAVERLRGAESLAKPLGFDHHLTHRSPYRSSSKEQNTVYLPVVK